jgi:hypothetical protein
MKQIRNPAPVLMTLVSARAIAVNVLLIIEAMVNCPAACFLQPEKGHTTGQSKNF